MKLRKLSTWVLAIFTPPFCTTTSPLSCVGFCTECQLYPDLSSSLLLWRDSSHHWISTEAFTAMWNLVSMCKIMEILKSYSLDLATFLDKGKIEYTYTLPTDCLALQYHKEKVFYVSCLVQSLRNLVHGHGWLLTNHSVLPTSKKSPSVKYAPQDCTVFPDDLLPSPGPMKVCVSVDLCTARMDCTVCFLFPLVCHSVNFFTITSKNHSHFQLCLCEGEHK